MLKMIITITTLSVIRFLFNHLTLFTRFTQLTHPIHPVYAIYSFLVFFLNKCYINSIQAIDYQSDFEASR